MRKSSLPVNLGLCFSELTHFVLVFCGLLFRVVGGRGWGSSWVRLPLPGFFLPRFCFGFALRLIITILSPTLTVSFNQDPAKYLDVLAVQMEKKDDELHLNNILALKANRHLVVDDEKANCTLLKRFIEIKCSSVVDEAESAEDALRLVNTVGVDGYDVIWTDLNMPGMNGLELAKELRRLGFRKYVALVTGAPPNEVQQAVKESCIDVVCLKPLRKKALHALPVMQLFE